MSEEMKDLAMKARNGNQEALLQLWQGVSRLACKIAMRYLRIAALNGAVDADDLEQCAFLGFHEAVQGFDPLQGSFTTLMGYSVRSACRRALGLDGRERTEHYTTTSLDAPIPGSDDITLADTIPDPASTDAYDQTELRQDIEKALHRLPATMGNIICLHDLDGLTLEQTAEQSGHPLNTARSLRRKGLYRLRKDRGLHSYQEPVRLRYKGYRQFQSDWTSVVEAEAIRRIDSK